MAKMDARQKALDEQTERAQRLVGRSIDRWSGVEMAILERGPDGTPQFHHPEVRCLQLFDLLISFTDDGQEWLATYQDNDRFGLWLELPDRRNEVESEGIYRQRDFDELPLGEVTAADVAVYDETFAELRLVVGGRVVLLIAGEIEEARDAGLSWKLLDESVLVFTDPAEAAQIDWDWVGGRP